MFRQFCYVHVFFRRFSQPNINVSSILILAYLEQVFVTFQFKTKSTAVFTYFEQFLNIFSKKLLLSKEYIIADQISDCHHSTFSVSLQWSRFVGLTSPVSFYLDASQSQTMNVSQILSRSFL